jgi:hypothetical protein
MLWSPLLTDRNGPAILSRVCDLNFLQGWTFGENALLRPGRAVLLGMFRLPSRGCWRGSVLNLNTAKFFCAAPSGARPVLTCRPTVPASLTLASTVGYPRLAPTALLSIANRECTAMAKVLEHNACSLPSSTRHSGSVPGMKDGKRILSPLRRRMPDTGLSSGWAASIALYRAQSGQYPSAGPGSHGNPWCTNLLSPDTYSKPYASFRNTRAEFFDPKAMQLQMACSMSTLRPTSGT